MLVTLRESGNPFTEMPYIVSWHEEGMPAHHREAFRFFKDAQCAINPAKWQHPEGQADADVLFVAYV